MDLTEILAKLKQLAEDETSDIELSIEELEVLEENFEQLDELSKSTLKSYISKSANDIATRAYKAGKTKKAASLHNRFRGISKAAEKLTKRGIYQKTKDKIAASKTVKEGEELSLDESEASNTLVPGGMPGDTRTSALAGLVGLTPLMSVEDITKLYNTGLEMLGKNASEISDDSAKNAASVAMKEDVSKVFEGDELTDEAKDKFTTLIESLVNLKVGEILNELEDTYAEALAEEVEAIETDLVEKLDTYLDHVAETYITENEVAITSSLKNDLTEDFIMGLKKLFEDHYIEIPESKVDVVEELIAKVASLEEDLDTVLTVNKELEESAAALSKELTIKSVSEGLSVIDLDKFNTLAEDIEFTTPEEFTSKLEVIKEGFFKKPANPSNVLTEEFEAEEKPSEHKYVDPQVSSIAAALGRTIRR